MGTERIEIWIPGPPVAKARARVTKSGVTYTPAKTRTWEGIARTLAMEAMGAQRLPLCDPLRLMVDIGMPVPSSWPEWKKRAALSMTVWPTGKPDADNILKAVKDSLTGVVWTDDALICSVAMVKFYTETPGVDVVVHAIQGQAAQTATRKRYEEAA